MEEAVGAAVKAGKRLVIDRCNVRSEDRKRILELAMQPRGAVAVHLTTPPDVCIGRVAQRTDHPTIPYGRGKPAVLSMAKALEPPRTAEGFAEVRTVGGEDELAALLRSWGGEPVVAKPQGIFKFPRTQHVLNTGGTAVTRDDLVMAPDDAARFHDGATVVIAEEKVDGANLGLSLTKDYEVVCQNRSHYVNAESHTQFRTLAHWLDEHRWALCELLVPEVEVLFGEWVAALHSVRYTTLPGHFLAFDIYNKRTRSFASVDERDRRLRGMGIPVVRTLARRSFASKDELLALLEEQSAYADGFVEGSYLRIDDEGGNVRRGKIVRPDFIQGCGEGHWLSKEPVKNGVRPDLWLDAPWHDMGGG